MAFVVKKKIHGNDYFYLNETKRVDGKVKAKTIAYLGKTEKEAHKKAETIIGKMEKKENTLEKKEISVEELAIFCKRRGFVYPSAEIYGGLSGFWDFGPIGVELKNNVKKEWWNDHVRKREDMTGIDGSIITNPSVWKASGHESNFVDYVVVDKKTKNKFKVDLHELNKYKKSDQYSVEGAFNTMFTTNVGPQVVKGSTAFLRPETAQLIFTNFKLVFENERMKLPFGIAQIGKSFRNEISPRDFLFRSREFEQMEIEYFIKPKTECPYEIFDVEVLVLSHDGQEKNKEGVKMKIKEAYEKKIIRLKWHAYWLSHELFWFKKLGVDLNNFRIRQHGKDELAHYSKDCWDIEYKFPFGYKELEGIADRGDYDLKKHEEYSKKDLKVFDEETKEKFLPEVVCEPSLGVERAFLVFMFDSFYFDKKRENFVLRINSRLAPVKAAIFPIVKKEDFEKISEEVFRDLSEEWNVKYDVSGSIGRRYARNDEIGTPYCITIDGDSLKNKDVTIRDRDTMKQIRVKIKDLRNVLRNLIFGEAEFEKSGKLLK